MREIIWTKHREAASGALASAAIILLAVLPALEATATSTAPASVAAKDDRRLLRVRMQDPAGKPIPKEQIKEFYCTDLGYEPLPLKIVKKNGEAVVFLPDPPQPIQVCTRLPVPDFGEVHIYADSAGKGYVLPGGFDFVQDAAETRINRVHTLLQRAKAEGISIPEKVYKRLNAAGHAEPYPLLAQGLWAGEELTLTIARERIKRLPQPRNEFLFGCNAFGLGGRGPIYAQRFKDLFNYGTANLYLTHYAPAPDVRDFARPDREVAWLLGNGLEATVCPPVYIARSVTPDWIKTLVHPPASQPATNGTAADKGPVARSKPPLDKGGAEGAAGLPSAARSVFYGLMYDAVKHYVGQVRFHEIVNEAHDFSNACRLTPAEFTDLAAACSEATHKADPKAQRIINCCHLWGEYAAHRRSDGTSRRSPMRYLKDCMAAEVEFEIVGLQMYYPEYDLFEIDRMLERYSRLGKILHITEMGCASAPGIDPNAQRKKADAGWHGPWSEATQADWVEGVYTIYYSKPYITAVSWWDLADAVSFWPYGGLCRGDLAPKPSYLRLQELQRSWGLRR